MGRRFRALRIWMVLSHFGLDGLRTFLLEKGVLMAAHCRGELEKLGTMTLTMKNKDVSRQVKVAFPVRNDLGLVCMQLVDAGDPSVILESETDALAHYLMKPEHNYFVLPSVLNGKKLIRIAMGGILTERETVDEMVGLVRKFVEQGGEL